MVLGRDRVRSREIGCKASGSDYLHAYPAAPAANQEGRVPAGTGVRTFVPAGGYAMLRGLLQGGVAGGRLP
jgi:hypothetical protein